VGAITTPHRYEAYRWTQSGGMVPLGDLPGNSPDDPFFSYSTDVSADGSVVVGVGLAIHRFEAFRWTSQDGMIGLGSLLGPDYGSHAYGVSANGSVIVGESANEAIRWSERRGMESIKDLLLSGGVDVADWQLREATAVSANGNVTVGWGYNPNGEYRGWIADLSGIVPEPSGEVMAVFAIVAMGCAIRSRTSRELYRDKQARGLMSCRWSP
jgi:uncharacterized membrane protein